MDITSRLTSALKDDFLRSLVSWPRASGLSISQIRARGSLRCIRGLRGPVGCARGHCTKLCREAVCSGRGKVNLPENYVEKALMVPLDRCMFKEP